MKKRILTFSLFAVGLVLVLFLLLPFLETTAPNTATDAAQAKKASPQIFTSNPLTDLVNRIARFFGKKNKTSAPTVADNRRLTAQQADQLFGISQEENAVYASQHEATTQTGSYTTPEQYEQALFQTTDGAWVLVHQKNPEGAAHGMHEINTRDNAYDTYIKQERMARFTPTAVAPKQESLPDSRLARLFRPIKKFFGWDDSTAARTGTIGVNGSKEGFVLASSERLGKNGKRKGSKFSRGLEVDAQPISLDGLPVAEAQEQKEKGYSGRDTDGTITMLNLLMPTQSARNVAELEATTKFGNPTDPDEKKAKEEYAKKVEADMLNEILYQPIKDAAGGKEPEELIGTTMTCKPKSLIHDACGDSDAPKLPYLKQTKETLPDGDEAFSDGDLEKAKQAAANLFKNKTQNMKAGGIDMPSNVNLTVVLGEVVKKDTLLEKAKGFSLPEEEKNLPDGLENLTEKQTEYLGKKANLFIQNHFLKKCEDTTCFWVANSLQNHKGLQNGIEAANFQFHGDPSGLYTPAYNELLSSLADKKLEEDLSLFFENDKEKELFENFVLLAMQENQPAYIPYTKEELQKIQQQNLDLITGSTPSKEALAKATVLYVPSAQHALSVSNALTDLGDGGGLVVYGKDNLSITEENSTPALRGLQVVTDVVNQMNETYDRLQEARTRAVNENLGKNLPSVNSGTRTTRAASPSNDKVNPELELLNKEASSLPAK